MSEPIKNIASWPVSGKISQPKKLALELLEANCLLLAFFHGDAEKIATWMTTKNPNFGGGIPLQLFMMGRGHKVLAFIKNAIDENKGSENG